MLTKRHACPLVHSVVAFATAGTLAAPALSPGQTVCRVGERSAAGIQEAIDRCSAEGGGRAVVPAGITVSGPVWLRDNVDLHLERGAVVRMSRSPADWTGGEPALVNAHGARNVAVSGAGTFDGAATWAYEPVRETDVEIAEEQEIARRAGVEMKRFYRTGEVQKYLFVLREAEDVRVEDVTIQNAPLWNVRLQDCNRVWIRGVRILSDLERGVNSDGIDIVSSSNVTISDSTVATADDAICLKTQTWRDAAGPARPVENVLVTNSILTSSSTAMMIGTETHADIRHVVFSNVVVRDSNKVFGINVQDGATVSDVRVQNVTFDTRRRHWNWWGGAEVMKLVLKRRSAASRLGRIDRVTFDGGQGTARGTSLVAGHAESPLRDITVANLHVRMLPEEAPDKRATHALVFERVLGLRLRNVRVEWDREHAEPGWGSALVLAGIEDLELRDWSGTAGRPGLPPVVERDVP